MAKKVIHLINGLTKAGAETMLYQVISHKQSEDIEYQVISLGEGDYYKPLLKEKGVKVYEFPFRKHPISSFCRIKKLIRGIDTLCCWMYHSNFLGYYLAKVGKVKKLIWGIHHSNLSKEFNKKSTLKINKWCAKRSGRVDTIIYCGDEPRRIHEEIGYDKNKGVVITNGIDIEKYNFVENARTDLVKEFNIDSDKKVILSVTRNHPIKDIPNFIRAVGKIKKLRKDLVAVACGNGVDTNNEEIVNLCKESDLQIGQDVFLLGLRNDVEKLTSACDLFVLHSAGEAFPITLVQAMSCKCLCVSTDVGDARQILDSSAYVVSPQDANLLADKIQELLNLPEDIINNQREQNRQRVINNYDINAVVEKYEKLY